jgi:REP element-mobilizing transposase RayT
VDYSPCRSEIFAAQSAAMSDDGDAGTRRRTRGYLPHMERAGATYFVTFRMADSLPQRVVEQLRQRKERLVAQGGKRELLPVESLALHQLSNKQLEGILDRAHGACPMLRPEAADEVAAAITHWDGERYELFAWVVMPNHVHVVFAPRAPHSLASVVSSWKSYTANRLNAYFERNGRLWQREYFDRLIRDDEEFERAVEYVAQNPAASGLRNWRWVWSCR